MSDDSASTPPGKKGERLKTVKADLNVSRCSRCGAAASGAFCSSCGAALKGARCRGCSATLSDGARFCHRCGTSIDASQPVNTPAARATNDPLPWIVSAIALVALIALVAGQKGFFGGGQQGVQPTAATAGGPMGGRAPDISRLTPAEITDRMFDRMMSLHERGLQDSLQIFKAMAIPAFDLHDSLDMDLRYDLGRIAEVSGEIPLARAQADTMLMKEPTNLLGLMLSANLARKSGDSAAARALDRRLLQAEKAELASTKIEYQKHRLEIDRAISAARGGSQ